jgi:glycosyltransferase involved in cell wall biosynthesis
VARLIKGKGVDVLLRAAAGLPGEWRAYVLGVGPLRESLVSLARELGLADRVVFDTPIPSTQMPAYLGGLDTLVLPSRTCPNWKEQFGRVLVEAMACGVPVIGSTCGEIPQVIGDAGLIFPEDDVEALRAALLRLQCDIALRRELAKRGRARVLANYTQNQIAAATVDVYRQMMRKA